MTKSVTQERKFDRADLAVIGFGLSALVRTIDLLNELEEVRLGLASGQRTPEEASHLMTDICSNAGMVSTCLFDVGPARSAREKPRLVAKRQARSRQLTGICAKVPLEVLTDRHVRNRLMHADEYLARLALTRPLVSACVIERRDMIAAAVGAGPLLHDRVLISSENMMLHLDKELDLGALLTSCEGAHQAISGAVGA